MYVVFQMVACLAVGTLARVPTAALPSEFPADPSLAGPGSGPGSRYAPKKLEGLKPVLPDGRPLAGTRDHPQPSNSV